MEQRFAHSDQKQNHAVSVIPACSQEKCNSGIFLPLSCSPAARRSKGGSRLATSELDRRFTSFRKEGAPIEGRRGCDSSAAEARLRRSAWQRIDESPLDLQFDGLTANRTRPECPIRGIRARPCRGEMLTREGKKRNPYTEKNPKRSVAQTRSNNRTASRPALCR